MPEGVVCRACGSPDLRDLGACAAYPPALAALLADPDPGHLLRCRRCGLGQRHPCASEAALAEVYRRTPAESMEYPFEDNAAWRCARDELLRRHRADADCAVLDVGCHTGRFLAGLPRRWRRFGIESATAPQARAAGEHGVEVIAPRLQDIGAQWRGRFDAVTLFDVLEHLPDPADALARAAALLRPNGILIASTGDMDAWTWRCAGVRHWYLQTPLHLSFASRAFFRFVAEREGLRLAGVSRIPHRIGTLLTRCRQAIEIVYWQLRQRGGWARIPQRLLQSLPGLRYLGHRESVPWTMRLRDHAFAVFTSPQT